MDLLNIIYFIILAISFLGSLSIYFENGAPEYLKFFPPFLAITFCVEMIGYYMKIRHVPNSAMYNFFTTFEFIFYFSVLYYVISQRTVRKIISVSIFVYPLIALLNILFFQGFSNLHTHTISLGAILVVIFSATYFYGLINHPVHARPLRISAFWICCGLLFFYSLTLPVIATKNLGIYKRSFYFLLMVTPNYMLYTLFTIAFLCRLKYSNRIRLNKVANSSNASVFNEGYKH